MGGLEDVCQEAELAPDGIFIEGMMDPPEVRVCLNMWECECVSNTVTLALSQ